MNSSPIGDDVALFIDWENFKISLAAGQRQPNVSALKEEAANCGRVVVAKAYADWVSRDPELRGASQFTNDPPDLYAAGIEPVYVPTRLPRIDAPGQRSTRRVRVKNSVDVKMTADCIECSHSHPNIGTYVLVTGDSDFIHVINALRTMGKRVIIIGVSGSTSRRLADQIDGLILYDIDVDPLTPPEPSPTTDGRGAARDTGPGRLELAEVIRAIEEIVRHERQVGRTLPLTSIKQRLMRRFPGFDEKKVGFSGFKKLMLRVAQEGNIKLTTAGMVDWAMMADEPDTQETLPESPGDGEGVPQTAGNEVVDRPAETPAPPVSGPSAPLSPAGQGDEPARDSTVTSLDLVGIMAETLAALDLPPGPGDGQDAGRVADLIVMADTLEHRQDLSHVAFNLLVAEVCQALDEGLKAEHPEITQRWAQAYSRSYVTRLVRSLGSGKLFERGWHTWLDQTDGRTKRRRTLYLNQAHPLVREVLRTRWEGTAYPEPAPDLGDEPAGPTPEFAPEPEGPAPDGSANESPALARYSLPLLRLFRPRRE